MYEQRALPKVNDYLIRQAWWNPQRWLLSLGMGFWVKGRLDWKLYVRDIEDWATYHCVRSQERTLSDIREIDAMNQWAGEHAVRWRIVLETIREQLKQVEDAWTKVGVKFPWVEEDE